MNSSPSNAFSIRHGDDKVNDGCGKEDLEEQQEKSERGQTSVAWLHGVGIDSP